MLEPAKAGARAPGAEGAVVGQIMMSFGRNSFGTGSSDD